MEFEKFQELWNGWSQEWYASKVTINDTTQLAINELCELTPDICMSIYKNYLTIKEATKTAYFKDPTKKLSRYKRAAVIVYAIIKTEPVVCTYHHSNKYDKYFLKQRLAFHIALGSILQDFDLEEVKSKKLYVLFENTSDRGSTSSNDTFLESVYKDFFYAEVYRNFNILTTANVFGLLIDRVAELKPLP